MMGCTSAVYFHIFFFVRTLNGTRSNFMAHHKTVSKKSVSLVRERTTPTERPPLVDEVSANFSG
jgi:hypothetical protein